MVTSTLRRTHSVTLALTLIATAATTRASDIIHDFPTAQLVADDDLALMRGGMLLPNGLDVAIGIDIKTHVNGVLALHSVLSTENPAPSGLRVLTSRDGGDPGPTPTSVGPRQVAQSPQLILDRRNGGATVTPTRIWSHGTTVNVVNAPRELWPTYPGERELAVSEGSAPVATSYGDVSVSRGDGGAVVTLAGDTLTIQHLLGQATGAVIANTANNQIIETVAAVDIDLQGAWPVITNAMFAVNTVAVDAATRN